MERRLFVGGAGLAGVLAAGVAPAVHAQATLRWRLASSFPKALDTIFGAADVFYAPVVSRLITYGLNVPGFAQAYMQAVWEHDWMQAWVAAAETEDWTIAQYEVPA